MTQSHSSRRQFLRLVGAIGVSGFSGCSALSSTSDARNEDTTTDRNATGEYEQWLLAPSEVAFGDTILLTSAQPNEIDSYRDHLPRIDTALPSGDDTMVPSDTIEHIHNFGSLAAVTGTFDAETAASGLSDQFSESGTYQGYSLYAAGDVQAYGIADGTVLASRSYEGADVGQNLREFIDTGDGEIPRLQDVNDAGRALVENLGSGASVRINTDADRILVPGAVMTGSTVSLGETESEVRAVVVFEDGATVDAERVRKTVAQTAMFDSAADVAVDTTGRAVVARGTVPTSELQSLQVTFEGDTAGSQPDINATMDYRAGNDGGRLVITHNGGDPIPRDRLSLRGSGFSDVTDVDATAPGTWAGTASGTVDGQSAVVFGDTMTVGVTPAYDIRLFVSDSVGMENVVSSSGPEA